jgi:predicted RND superfamily exporter protein
VADIIKRLNQNLHGDDEAFYRIPTTREETAQYLLLYELSLPQGLGLDTLLDVTRSKSQLLVFVERTDSERLVVLDERATAWLDANATTFTAGEGTGIAMVFAHINHRNIRSLLKGMALALLIISLLLVFVLRSVRLGVLSLLTNLAPAGLAYGVWGMTNGYIDLSASVVMCMSLGIVVDDTVHFLSKYLRARRVRGLSPIESMRYTFNTVGVALCTTTAVLVSGFAILAFSHFSPSVVTGSLLAMTLGFALIVDLLFMPALLMVLGGAVVKT